MYMPIFLSRSDLYGMRVCDYTFSWFWFKFVQMFKMDRLSETEASFHSISLVNMFFSCETICYNLFKPFSYLHLERLRPLNIIFQSNG